MDKVRISEKNRINTRIREVESFTRFNSSSISRLRGSNGNIEFNRNKIAKMKKENETFSEEIKELQERLADLASGKIDAELKRQRREDTLAERKKTTEKRKKKIDEMEEKKVQHAASKDYWDRTIKAAREHRYSDRSAKRGYDYVLRVQRTLPQYIRANLSSMPNNKGYIWRGVHYYGLKDPEGKNANTIMFENSKGQLYIHEWSHDFLKYTKKVKRDKRGKTETLFIEKFRKDIGGRRVSISKVKPPPPKQRRSLSRNHSRRHKMTPAEARRRSRGRGTNGTNKPRNNGVTKANQNPRHHKRDGNAKVKRRRPRNNNKRKPRESRPKTKPPDRGVHRTLPAWMTRKKDQNNNK
tara:strand:- start:9118 stop:10179 length:1062 start_codon:yes stop_codon:yes gene_type:complete